MAKSMREQLAEARARYAQSEERMALLEEENLQLKKGASLKPEIQEILVSLKPAKKSKGGKFRYEAEDTAKGVMVYVYSSKPLATKSSVFGQVK